MPHLQRQAVPQHTTAVRKTSFVKFSTGLRNSKQRAVPGCSGGVPGVFRGVPGVFRGCSGVFRGVPGVFRVLQTPVLEAKKMTSATAKSVKSV